MGNQANQDNFNHRSFARGPKLDFPEFNRDNVDAWIKKANKYFELAKVPWNQRVEIAVLYLVDRAEIWWAGSGINMDSLSWHQFCMMIGKRFSDYSVYDVVASFHSVKQHSSVSSYIDKFEEAMALVRRDNPHLPEEYYIRSFVAGLREYIQSHSQLQNPLTLSDAYWVAKRLEQANPFKKAQPSTYKENFRGNQGNQGWYNSRNTNIHKNVGSE